MKEVFIPDKYGILIDRSRFEYKMAISNMAFMLNKHLDDAEAQFINSELYNTLLNELVNARINTWVVDIGVLISMGYSTQSLVVGVANEHDYYIVGEKA